MSAPVIESGQRLNLTATDASLADVMLMGVFVAQAGGTLKVADTKGNIANTFTPTAGVFYPLPCKTIGAVTITITGAVDCTVFYQ
jgi:hypothetical protein